MNKPSLFVFILLTFCLSVEIECVPSQPIWRRFGVDEDIVGIIKMLGQKKKWKIENAMIEKLKETFDQKQKEYEVEMEEKRRRIFNNYLVPHSGPTSVLSDLYNRF